MNTRLQMTTPSDREIHVERVFDAPRERVWNALTDPALLAQWWGRGNKLEIERFEPQPGGHWRFVENLDGERFAFEGRFRALKAPERLEETFEWDGMPGHVSVDTYTLEPLPDGKTKLSSDTLFLTAEDCEGMLKSGMEEGLAQSYDALDRLLGET